MCCFHYLKVVVGVEVVLGWHLALHHFPDSAVMAIPVELRQPPGSTDETIMCVEVVLDALPVPVVVTAVNDIVGFPITWRSWSWQVQKLPESTAVWMPAVRAFKEVDDAPMLQIAARAGWWNLGVAIMEKIGRHLGRPIAGGDDMYENLLQLTKKVLPTASDDDLLLYLRERLKRMKKKAQFSEELLSIDDALVCLDQADQEEAHRQQLEAKDKQKEGKRFKESYRKHAGEVRTSKAKTKTDKKAAMLPKFTGPRSLPSGVMSQAEAKRRMPVGAPKTYLWRANTPGAWNGRVADMPCISRNDAHYGGEQFALRLVLQGVWADWLPLNGFELHQCPILGLMDQVDPRTARGAAVGGAAASSAGP